MPAPTLTPSEIRNRATFLGLMWALSHPGRLQPLPGAFSHPPYNLLAIGETLLDLETSFYTPDPGLATALARSSARQETPANAAYHFYPSLTSNALQRVAEAAAGDMLYPDRSATLVIGCSLGRGISLRLKGPGIAGVAMVNVDGIPYEFWTTRQRARRYPLGWDLFLVSGGDLIGIPRTCDVTVVGA